jgi:solute carrier family 26 (sodium-independent sulfate anion transporter), member 11
VITLPSTLYEFWKISPLDVIVFFVGLSITVFHDIEQGIFATIILSLIVLIFRIFHAHGAFLGRVRIRTVKYENEKWSPTSSIASESSDCFRNVYLPLNRKDGSNPDVKIERPAPGVLIYRFSEGFNFPNANSQLDYMTDVILAETRPTIERKFDRPGDRPWNDTTTRRGKDAVTEDNRPTLKAVILDFSAVNNVDLTSIQTLVDIRNQLDKHAAPNAVQWHFACIYSRWTKRALAAAGFGYPSFKTESGEPEHFTPIYSLAEMQIIEEFAGGISDSSGNRRRSVAQRNSDVELGDVKSSGEKVIVSHTEDIGGSSGSAGAGTPARLAAVHGINRPFFHSDVQSALVSAMETEELGTVIEEEAEDEQAFTEAIAAIAELEKAGKVQKIENIN